MANIKHTNRFAKVIDYVFYALLVLAVFVLMVSLFIGEYLCGAIFLGATFFLWLCYEFVKMVVEISINVADISDREPDPSPTPTDYRERREELN